MLAEQLLKDWLAREKSSHVHEFPRFEVEGLLLGTDTVLVGPQPETVEARLEALLAVAYGQPPTRDTLRHVKAAADLWAQGCEGRAPACTSRWRGSAVYASQAKPLAGCSWPMV
ncbi:MAG: hypothetical protein P4L73_17035 [Caulobacteraceae bacterium]|nr:hypothetical protein [Caulobacteraceae bacterium]